MGKNFFSITVYSFYIFEGNYIQFKKTIESYIEAANSDEVFFGDGSKLMDLHISGGREIARVIHNYVAAWFSLVDHTRAVQKKLKESTSNEIQEFAIEYETRLTQYLSNAFENVFVKDLRRYVQHKKVQVPTLNLHLKRSLEDTDSCEEGGAMFQGGYTFDFNSKDIKDFDWHQKSKDYIKQNSTVSIAEIIDKHFMMMKDFYLWIQFRDSQLNPYSPSKVKEVTFEEWKQMNMNRL